MTGRDGGVDENPGEVRFRDFLRQEALAFRARKYWAECANTADASDPVERPGMSEVISRLSDWPECAAFAAALEASASEFGDVRDGRCSALDLRPDLLVRLGVALGFTFEEFHERVACDFQRAGRPLGLNARQQIEVLWTKAVRDGASENDR